MSEAGNQAKQVLEGYVAAVFAKDAEAFMKLYSQDVRVFDAWGVWSYEGAPAWGLAVRQWFSSLGDERVAVSLDDVSIAGDHDLAMINAIVTYAAMSSEGEKLRSMQNRLTWVMKRQGQTWSIVHEHSSAPVGFDDFKAILHRR